MPSLYCLLADSPDCDDAEQQRQSANMAAVVNHGRQPGLQLEGPNGRVSMADWGNELLAGIAPICRSLDGAHGGEAYQSSLQQQQARLEDPELTPSARMLREMSAQELPFFRLAMAYSEQWAEYYRDRQLDPASQQHFAASASESLQQQKALEEADNISFEQYLANFYIQYDQL